MEKEKPIRPLMMEPEVAAILGVNKATLMVARRDGKPLLPFVRVGVKGIRYRPADVETYFVTQTNAPKPKRAGGAS